MLSVLDKYAGVAEFLVSLLSSLGSRRRRHLRFVRMCVVNHGEWLCLKATCALYYVYMYYLCVVLIGFFQERKCMH